MGRIFPHSTSQSITTPACRVFPRAWVSRALPPSHARGPPRGGRRPGGDRAASRGDRGAREDRSDRSEGFNREVALPTSDRPRGLRGTGPGRAGLARRAGGRAPGRPARCLSPGRLPLAGASEKADPPAAAWTPPSTLAAPRRGRMPPVHSRSARPYRTSPRSSGGRGALVTTTCAGRGASVRRLAAARCGTGGGGVLGAECSPRCLHNCRM